MLEAVRELLRSLRGHDLFRMVAGERTVFASDALERFRGASSGLVVTLLGPDSGKGFVWHVEPPHESRYGDLGTLRLAPTYLLDANLWAPDLVRQVASKFHEAEIEVALHGEDLATGPPSLVVRLVALDDPMLGIVEELLVPAAGPLFDLVTGSQCLTVRVESDAEDTDYPVDIAEAFGDVAAAARRAAQDSGGRVERVALVVEVTEFEAADAARVKDVLALLGTVLTHSVRVREAGKK